MSVIIGAPNGHLVRITIAASDVATNNGPTTRVDAASLLAGIDTISRLNVSAMTKPALLNDQEIWFRAIDILFHYMKLGHPVVSDDDAGACHLIALKLEFEFEKFEDGERTPEVIEREAYIIKSLGFNVAFPNAHQMLLASIHALGGGGDKGFRDRGESYIRVCAVRCPALYSSRSAAAIADAAYLSAWLTRGPAEEYGDETRVLAETTGTLDAIIPIMRAMAAHGSLDAARIEAFASSRSPEGSPSRGEDMNVLYCASTPSPVPDNDIRTFYDVTGPRLGKGSFGVVVAGNRKNEPGIKCAIKKPTFNFRSHGVDENMLIEVAILKAIPKYKYIVNLLDAYLGASGRIYGVYELSTDETLAEVVDAKPNEATISDVMFQITCGVAFVHSYGRVHRDLKPSNILVNIVNGRYCIKVADFGSAVSDPMFPRPMLHVSTLWYRAPESLFHHQMCDEAIDVWALGCIMVELINSKALFAGKSEVDMIILITRVLGKPNAPWARFSQFPDGTDEPVDAPLPNFAAKDIAGELTNKTMSGNCVDLIRKVLAYPESRITSYAMLDHPFFTGHGHSATAEPFVHNKEMHAMQLDAKRKRDS